MHPTSSHGGAQWHQCASSESLCLATTTRTLVTIPELVLLQSCLLVRLVTGLVIVQNHLYGSHCQRALDIPIILPYLPLAYGRHSRRH